MKRLRTMGSVLMIIGLLGYLGLMVGCQTMSPNVAMSPQDATESKNPTPNVQENAQTQDNVPGLTPADVGAILAIAVNDIRGLKCEPLFFNEYQGYIWCECQADETGKPATIKIYRMKNLVENYKQQRKAAE